MFELKFLILFLMLIFPLHSIKAISLERLSKSATIIFYIAYINMLQSMCVPYIFSTSSLSVWSKWVWPFVWHEPFKGRPHSPHETWLRLMAPCPHVSGCESFRLHVVQTHALPTLVPVCCREPLREILMHVNIYKWNLHYIRGDSAVQCEEHNDRI